MSEPTCEGASPEDPVSTAQQALIATSYARAAFCVAAIALGISGMAAGPALLGWLRPGVLDRVMLGLWLLMGITSLADLVLLPKRMLTRPQVVASVTSAAGAFVMIVAQGGKGLVTGVALAAASALMVTGYVASRKHHCAVMARVRTPVLPPG
jgi:hypothetical protein